MASAGEPHQLSGSEAGWNASLAGHLRQSAWRGYEDNPVVPGAETAEQDAGQVAEHTRCSARRVNLGQLSRGVEDHESAVSGPERVAHRRVRHRQQARSNGVEITNEDPVTR